MSTREKVNTLLSELRNKTVNDEMHWNKNGECYTTTYNKYEVGLHVVSLGTESDDAFNIILCLKTKSDEMTITSSSLEAMKLDGEALFELYAFVDEVSSKKHVLDEILQKK